MLGVSETYNSVPNEVSLESIDGLRTAISLLILSNFPVCKP